MSIVSGIEILADAETPPFQVDDDGPVDENLRLRHRTLDLRRTPMREALELRHRVIQTIRAVLDERDFLEIETPFLTRSTPEGARDFLVPARTDAGLLLRAAAVAAALQAAADGRRPRALLPDRPLLPRRGLARRPLPEFTQLDIEMAFVAEDDVLELMEAVFGTVFVSEGFDVPPPPWPRITWAEAMSRWGSTAPTGDSASSCTTSRSAVASAPTSRFSRAPWPSAGGRRSAASTPARASCLAPTSTRSPSSPSSTARKGLVWAFVQEDGTLRSPIAKFLLGG